MTPPRPISAAGPNGPRRGGGAFLERLAAVPVVAILRAADAGRFLEVGRVLYEGGVRAIEVTLTSRGALEAFGRLNGELPGDAVLGVGTVRSVGDAELAVEAGATYLVAPDFRPEVVAWAVGNGVPVVPGALTPTEVAAAWAAGATAVKVFPVSAVGGPAYVKAVRAPLPEVPLVPDRRGRDRRHRGLPGRRGGRCRDRVAVARGRRGARWRPAWAGRAGPAGRAAAGWARR